LVRRPALGFAQAKLWGPLGTPDPLNGLDLSGAGYCGGFCESWLPCC
jgi:hypothetical protein